MNHTAYSRSAIQKRLFAIPGAAVYVVLDGASVQQLPKTLSRLGAEMECLYPGELGSDLAQVVPYLATVPRNHPLTDWLIQEGWGKHWGIFAVSLENLRTLRMHFRALLKIYGPDLEPLYFRYYDPRVLRTYLPTCNTQELRKVFGPMLRYIMEGEKLTTLMEFSVQEGACRSELVDLTPS